MAVMPGATWRPLPENSTQARIKPTQIILHTAVDQPGPTRLERYFARQDVGVESHVWIPLGGEIVQMMDTEVRADANRQANLRPDGTGAISIETEDEGDPVGVPWTDAQLDSIEAFIRWASLVHGIPLKVCTSPTDPGIGFHAMWGAPSAWTPSAGKTCPGPTRILQFHEVLIPRLLKEPDMSMPEPQARELTAALYEALLLRSPDKAGLDFWTSVGAEKGSVALVTGFIVGARKEIQEARSRQAAEQTRSAAQIKALEAELESVKRAGTAAQVNTEELTEIVAEAIIGRLRD